MTDCAYYNLMTIIFFRIFRALLLCDLLNLNKILLMSFLTFIFPKIGNHVYIPYCSTCIQTSMGCQLFFYIKNPIL